MGLNNMWCSILIYSKLTTWLFGIENVSGAKDSGKVLIISIIYFFLTRKKEHIRNVKNCSKGSNISNHAWSNNHSIDLKGTFIVKTN